MSSLSWATALLALALLLAVGFICALITGFLNRVGGPIQRTLRCGGAALSGVLAIGIALLAALGIL